MKPSELKIGMILDIPNLYAKVKTKWKVVTIYDPEFIKSSPYPSHAGLKRTVARVVTTDTSWKAIKYVDEGQLLDAREVKIITYQGYRKKDGTLVFSCKKLKLPKVEGAKYEDII